MRITAPRRFQFAAAVTAVGVMTFGLVGCSRDTPASTNGPSSAAPADSMGGVNPASVSNEVSSRRDVTQGQCKHDASSATLSGSVRNSGSKDANYTITITFTDEKYTVHGAGETKVLVPAGQSKDWSVTAKYTTTKNVVCVLRGVVRNDA